MQTIFPEIKRTGSFITGGAMNHIDFPGPNSQFLFEQMMTDAIVFMIQIVSVFALSACLFYLVALILLMWHEPESRAARPKTPFQIETTKIAVSTAESYSGVFVMRNRGLVRIATMAGIFLAALLVSRMLPEIAGMVGGR